MVIKIFNLKSEMSIKRWQDDLHHLAETMYICFTSGHQKADGYVIWKFLERDLSYFLTYKTYNLNLQAVSSSSGDKYFYFQKIMYSSVLESGNLQF